MFPAADSYGWEDAWNYNWAVINSSFSTMNTSTGALATRITTLETWQSTAAPKITASEAWQSTMTPHVAQLNTSTEVFRVWQASMTPHIAQLNASTEAHRVSLSTNTPRIAAHDAFLSTFTAWSLTRASSGTNSDLLRLQALHTLDAAVHASSSFTFATYALFKGSGTFMKGLRVDDESASGQAIIIEQRSSGGNYISVRDDGVEGGYWDSSGIGLSGSSTKLSSNGDLLLGDDLDVGDDAGITGFLGVGMARTAVVSSATLQVAGNIAVNGRAEVSSITISGSGNSGMEFNAAGDEMDVRSKGGFNILLDTDNNDNEIFWIGRNSHDSGSAVSVLSVFQTGAVVATGDIDSGDDLYAPDDLDIRDAGTFAGSVTVRGALGISSATLQAGGSFYTTSAVVTVAESTRTIGAYPLTDFYSVVDTTAPDSSNGFTWAVDMSSGNWTVEFNWTGITATTCTIRAQINGDATANRYKVINKDIFGYGPWSGNTQTYVFFDDDGGDLSVDHEFAGANGFGGSRTIRLNRGVGPAETAKLHMRHSSNQYSPYEANYGYLDGSATYEGVAKPTSIRFFSGRAACRWKGRATLYRSN